MLQDFEGRLPYSEYIKNAYPSVRERQLMLSIDQRPHKLFAKKDIRMIREHRTRCSELTNMKN